MDDKQAPNMQRFQVLDAARGIAVLGILLINMFSFALPEVARSNPQLLAGANSLDLAVWYLLHVFVDTKFITMLALVFGASLWFFGEHKAGDDIARADALQFRRSCWLLAFGLLHSYMLWDGDVLFTYAVCALIAWHWRQWGDGRLLKTSAAILVVGGLPALLIATVLPGSGISYPTVEEIAKDIAHYQQGWWAMTPERIGAAIILQAGVVFSGWSSLALMLVGIVLARRGFFTFQAQMNILTRLIAVTLVPGLLLIALSLGQNIQRDFAADYNYTYGYQLHFWGSTLVGFAYLLIVVQWFGTGSGLLMRRVLAAVGRMALSIYIMQSLICTGLFYGYGLGLFGQLSLPQIMLVVACIWILQCMFAYWWLNRFYFGPLEWIWRSLVYRRPQVLKR